VAAVLLPVDVVPVASDGVTVVVPPSGLVALTLKRSIGGTSMGVHLDESGAAEVAADLRARGRLAGVEKGVSEQDELSTRQEPGSHFHGPECACARGGAS